ncbi:MAG: hypothetical protein CL678_09870 [Bdellovibrionaceae bacterium]|nr:hypothetical protein [Pseudobdellovibrionaceae bacterium]|tara:strand:- start:1238 stop:1651 length:414 start_codon:yes stop_codon:yes gene_type:complete
MKKLLLSFVLVVGLVSSSFADDLLNQKEQYAIANKVAKKVRRKLHQTGYDDVSTTNPGIVSLENLNKEYSERDQYEYPLKKEEFSKLYACIHSEKCGLWSFDSSSDYMSGYGVERHFVLIDLNSSKYRMIKFLVYSE